MKEGPHNKSCFDRNENAKRKRAHYSCEVFTLIMRINNSSASLAAFTRKR